MTSRTFQLENHHSRIAEWAAAGQTLRQMAASLQAEGIDVDFNAVNRYCKAKGIALTKKKEAPPEAIPQPQTPPAPTSPAPKPAHSIPHPPIKSSDLLPFPPAPMAPPTSAAESKRDTAAKPTPKEESPDIALSSFGTHASFKGIQPPVSHIPAPIVLPPVKDPPLPPSRPTPKKTRPSSRPSPPRSPAMPRPPARSPQAASPPPPPPAPPQRAQPLAPQSPVPPSPPPARPQPPQPAPQPQPVFQPKSVPPEPAPAPILQRPAPRIPDWALKPWRTPQLPFEPLPTPPFWTLDLPLLQFSQNPSDFWTLRDACEGAFIMGSTGSGKTSGSGKTIAHSFLDAGFGGLVLTVKPEERELWELYARQTGREEHLCVVSPGGPFRFNFLDYESRRGGMGNNWIETITHLFQSLMEIYSRGRPSEEHGFWDRAGKQLLRNTLRVIACSRPYLRLDDISHLIQEAPSTLAMAESGSWRSTPTFGPLFEEACRTSKGTNLQTMIAAAHDYWMQDFPKLTDRTRSVLVTSFSSMIDGFFSPAIHELFCQETTLIPESTQQGAIIIIDLPIKQYEATGLFAQHIWKYFFQKAIERRTDPAGPTRRPIFLWADESHYFHSEYDPFFQSTARSCGCATVCLSQNISAYYGLFGGNRYKVDGFLGNFNTKIFHANNDPATNTWAADQIGKSMQYRASVQLRDDPPPRTLQGFFSRFYSSGSSKATVNPQIDYPVQPSEFAALRTGGPHNDFQVDAYFVKSGARFSNGKHYFKTTFLQEQR